MKTFLNFNFISLLLVICIGLFSCQEGTKESDNSNATSDSLLRLKAEELAHKYIITDGHIDLPYRLKKNMADVSRKTTSGDFDYVRAKKGGLDAPFMSIYIPAEYELKGGGMALADSLMEMVRQIASQNPDKFALASSPADIRENFEAGRISLPMGMENGTPIGRNLENIESLFMKGIRYITLTHSKDNQICDSSYDTTRTWNGLSPFGREVVRKMNETGIMVDVSHISDSAFYQVMEITNAPVIASHSSCRYFTPGFERNMSDGMIRKLAENKGVIQINFGSTFIDKDSRSVYDSAKVQAREWLKENNMSEDDPESEEITARYFIEHGGRTTVSAVADHIDHVVKLVGINYVGFGSDFDGVGDTLPEGLRDVSQYPNLIYELLKRGYSEGDIKKICHENVFRVWSEVDKVAGNHEEI